MEEIIVEYFYLKKHFGQIVWP